MKIKTASSLKINRSEITSTITKFWDQTSLGWQTIWGPHIHHGYYENDDDLTPVAAQEKLIKKLIELINILPSNKILDVGCGLGGSSLYLAKYCNAIVTGITLSSKQVSIAKTQANLQNLKNLDFKIEDALSLQSFADNSFDIVWSLESCEQFFNKELFIQQAYRVLKPGGKLLLVTWCSDREEYQDREAKQYRKLCNAFDLPYMPTINYYRSLLDQQGFELNNLLDWTTYVAKSWGIGLSLLGAYNLYQIFKLAGWRGIKMAYQIKLMRDAYRDGRIRYGVFLVTKAKV